MGGEGLKSPVMGYDRAKAVTVICMTYRDFKLHELLKTFDLTLREQSDLFGQVADGEPSDYLTLTLKQNVNLAVAINTEKARSELIVAPVLLEVKHRFADQVSLFSGTDFTVDSTQGLGSIG